MQILNIISDKAFLHLLKVRLEKWCPLHAIITVVLVVANEPLKVHFRLEF